MTPIVSWDTLLQADADQPRARATDPETSHEAAASVDLRESQRMVLNTLRAHGNLHDKMLVSLLPSLSPSRVRTARHELVLAGKVRDTGEKAYDGKTRHILWAAV